MTEASIFMEKNPEETAERKMLTKINRGYMEEKRDEARSGNRLRINQLQETEGEES